MFYEIGDVLYDGEVCYMGSGVFYDVEDVCSSNVGCIV